MAERCFFYICNALDDVTREERHIVTDSPAASRKVFMLMQAARSRGIRGIVLSMGRGSATGERTYFRSKAERVAGVPVVYLPFSHVPLFSELLTLTAFVPLLWRLRKMPGRKTALFYNRLPGYIFALLSARLFGMKTTLDLEDGETFLTEKSVRGMKARAMRWLFDTFCSGGALLACTALEKSTALRPVQTCYGVTDVAAPQADWPTTNMSILFGGTVAAYTGATLLIDTLKTLRARAPEWAKQVTFEITGKGESMGQFSQFADAPGVPAVVVHGRTSDEEYRQILKRARVGLSLRPNLGALADTTFPSKVIEFASNDILVLATETNDIAQVLGEGAIYLGVDDVDLLIEKIQWIVQNRAAAREVALTGMRAVGAKCSPENVGKMLDDFLFGNQAMGSGH